MMINGLAYRVGVVVALFAIAGMACARTNMEPREIELSMRRLLPLGSQAGRVTSVLDSMGVEHSAYTDSSKRVLAIWRATKRRVASRVDVQVVFGFDSLGGLTSIQAKELFTGP
jgi:hypothetical protein